MLSSIEKKNQRREAILSSLDKLKFATRAQLQKIHVLGTDRNAQRVLNDMKDWLAVKTHNGMNVYYLNGKGRELIGSEEETKWTLQVDHHLMRNDMYIFFNQPIPWQTEQKITFQYQDGLIYKPMTFVPDVTFQLSGQYHFLEVDRTQSMVENKKKIELYAKIAPIIHKQFGHTPVLVFYTLTPLRREKLTELCRSHGLTCKVYTKEDTR